ncbi:MAG: QcrA and Rieske domain-containing protein [Candidatus Dormibacteria bacterium]
MALNPYESSRGRLHARAEATRRQFLLFMGGLAGLGATLFGGVEILKFMFPVASGNAPALFKTDFTFDQLTGGVVNGKPVTPVNVLSQTDKRVTVVLDDAGIYAVLLICTHLGCTPNYVTDIVTGSGVSAAVADVRGVRTPSQQLPNGWACPCHGSRYFIDSTNFYGPAPRPMDWVNIEVTPDGYFAVDRATLVATRGPGDNTAPAWRLLVSTKKTNGKTLGV